MHLPHRLVSLLTSAALVVALGACAPGPERVDPLSEPTPFSFEVANPDEVVGPVFGVMLTPFEPNPMFGGRALAPAAADLEGFVYATIDAALDADGLVTGSLISVYDFPRINEALGLEFGWLLFFPPEGCPMTATNGAEAALAPLPYMAVWDGESFVGDEPDADAIVYLENFERVDGEGSAYTETFVGYVPVASQSAWSASTDGPCVPDEEPNATLTVDVAIDAGWQFLRYTSVRTSDGVDMTYADELVSLTLDEVAAAGIIGEARPPGVMPLESHSAPSTQAGLSLLFR